MVLFGVAVDSAGVGAGREVGFLTVRKVSFAGVGEVVGCGEERFVVLADAEVTRCLRGVEIGRSLVGFCSDDFAVVFGFLKSSDLHDERLLSGD